MNLIMILYLHESSKHCGIYVAAMGCSYDNIIVQLNVECAIVVFHFHMYVVYVYSPKNLMNQLF